MTTAPARRSVQPPPARVDPFAPTVDGVYRDPLVEVGRTSGARARRTRSTVRTAHFDVVTGPERVQVRHLLAPDDVDDDLAGLLAAELFGPGWLRGTELFERVFTGVVRSLDPDPLLAWGHFYRNTLRRAAHLTGPGGLGEVPTGAGGAHGTLAGYVPVWTHAAERVAEVAVPHGRASALDVGACFGFFALRLAAAGHAVVASDVEDGTVSLLAALAPALGVPLRTLTADAAHVPLPDRAVDVVLALHLLEHLDADHGARVIDEAVRLAQRRVVVAVPLETEADETWGHVRTITLDDLHRWGRTLARQHGVTVDVHEHHGGWLVLDR